MKAVDAHVGQMIRLRRKALGLSQQGLAGWLGLTFQQVQKYERGANRVSASTLWSLAELLRCEVSFFFEGLPNSERREPHGDLGQLGLVGRNFLGADGGLELAKLYLTMPGAHRRA